MSDSLPLQGIRVMDLTRALSGPFCTTLLGDLGAEIIKIESVKSGDSARIWPPYEGDHSLYFEAVNRGKKSIAIDFYSDEGREILKDIANNSDVIVENFRPGVLAKTGLDPVDLRKGNPDLVVQSISGFGQTGPLSQYAGLDQVIQAMSGIMSVTGSDSDNTFRVGLPIVDIVTGIFSALGVTAALAGRAQVGTGLNVATSLLESAVAISVFQGQSTLSNHTVPEPHGNDHPVIVPYGAFATKDVPIVIAVGSDKHWIKFCNLIGLPDLPEDPRYVGSGDRFTNRDVLKTDLEAALVQKPAAEWMHEIREAGIPAGPIYTYDQVFEDEQVNALEMVQTVRRENGSTLPLVRGPLSVNGRPTPVQSAPPTLGNSTEEVLEGIGYTADRIRNLASNGVIRLLDEAEARA
ncbi:CaiB/BaiF CoA transferase family protein [Brevibacterium sp. FME37]|uniref:CaiB/BaiF CoA transferase family protein n=1 Tax=Brevibacterium sp. FME37 TaxID=2742607 RepID=UPI0018680C94|nr:CoA transferase [Brevibacterium sp. FME37]